MSQPSAIRESQPRTMRERLRRVARVFGRNSTSWVSPLVFTVLVLCFVLGDTWRSAHEAGGAPIEHVHIVDMQTRNDAGEGFLGMGDCLSRGSGPAVTLTLRSSDAPAGKPATFTAAGCGHQRHVGDAVTARRVGTDRVQIQPQHLTVVNMLMLAAVVAFAFAMTAWRRRRARQGA